MVDRIPIATKGGKTAAGKDQIIHYTQQHGGKVILFLTSHMIIIHYTQQQGGKVILFLTSHMMIIH